MCPSTTFHKPDHAFCKAKRPLMPAGLRNAERERLLGRMWKALSKTERRARKAQASVAAEAAPTPAPTSCTTTAAPRSGTEEMLGGVPDATSQSGVMSSAESESAPAATTTKFVWQASLESAAQARWPCHTALRIACTPHACV